MLTRFEQFSASVFCISRDVQKLEREEMERLGLKGAFAQYLLLIRRFPQGITAATLCTLCDKDKAAVSRTLAEMEHQGLILRSGENAYRAKILLTQSGSDAAAWVARRAATAVALAGQGLSDEDRTIFYRALDRIAANLQSICAAGLPDPAQDKETDEICV